MIAVEEIRPGFSITLPRGGDRVVSRVDEFEDGVLVVVYFQHGEWSYENKQSAAKGGRFHHRLVEHGLRPLRRGELVNAEHGSTIKAEHLRRRMELEQDERFERTLDRLRG